MTPERKLSASTYRKQCHHVEAIACSNLCAAEHCDHSDLHAFAQELGRSYYEGHIILVTPTATVPQVAQYVCINPINIDHFCLFSKLLLQATGSFTSVGKESYMLDATEEVQHQKKSEVSFCLKRKLEHSETKS